jgi:hypothetical protein
MARQYVTGLTKNGRRNHFHRPQGKTEVAQGRIDIQMMTRRKW